MFQQLEDAEHLQVESRLHHGSLSETLPEGSTEGQRFTKELQHEAQDLVAVGQQIFSLPGKTWQNQTNEESSDLGMDQYLLIHF